MTWYQASTDVGVFKRKAMTGKQAAEMVLAETNAKYIEMVSKV